MKRLNGGGVTVFTPIYSLVNPVDSVVPSNIAADA